MTYTKRPRAERGAIAFLRVAMISLAIFFGMVGGAGQAAAAGLPSLSFSHSSNKSSLDTFLDDARKDGSTVIVVRPAEQGKAASPQPRRPLPLRLEAAGVSF